MDLDLPRPGPDRSTDRSTSRRRFLTGAAGVTGAAVASRMLTRDRSPSDESYESIVGAERSYSTLRYWLQVDGGNLGALSSFAGGAINAPVIESTVVEHYRKKHLGTPRYEDIVLECGLGMSGQMYQWISRAMMGIADSLDGEILGVDADNKVRSRLLFFGAEIIEIAFPTLDSSSKSKGTFRVTLRPGLITYPSPNARAPSRIGTGGTWLESAFRMRLGDLPAARVSKIEGLEIAISNTPTDPLVDFPNLALTIAAADLGPWRAWFESFLIDGLNTDAHEKDGLIDLLASDFKKVLGRISLHNVGIFRLADQSGSGSPDGVKRFRAEIYSEFMTFEFRPFDGEV